MPVDWVFVVTPISLVLGGIFAIGTIGLAAVGIFGFVIGVPVTIFNQIFMFEEFIHVYRMQSRGLMSYFIRAILWLRNEKLPEFPPDDGKGARLATPQEIIALYNPDAPEAMTFGHLGKPLVPQDRQACARSWPAPAPARASP